MLSTVFHAWERRLHARDNNRLVRPFEWGLDWIGEHPRATDEESWQAVAAWARSALACSDEFFAIPAATEYAFEDDDLRYHTGLATPDHENNIVHARYLRETDQRGGPRRAVVVLPQWNADEEGHVGLCRLLARFGLGALRLSLPYHDRRMPPHLDRADYIVSANVGRTLHVCRQAVIDARLAVRWLKEQGYERIGILGTSLGSCLAMLTASHEPLITAQALNHVSPWFADVVWEGLSTSHVRAALETRIDLERLREAWLPISPLAHLHRVRAKTMLVYALYDLTFPLPLSRHLLAEFSRHGIPHERAMLPCGHYTTGVTPFKFLDAWYLVRFLRRAV